MLEEWRKYESEAKLHRVTSVFGLIIGVVNVILMVYEAFIFLLGWEIPQALKPYEDFMGGHLLLLGWGILGIAGVFIAPPKAPDEEINISKIPKEEGKKRDLSEDDDWIKHSTTVTEPYSSIFGTEPSTHQD
ncbi:MAG: hypothetical protein ABGX12_04985 [Desulfurobacteriaceae bacterium]